MEWVLIIYLFTQPPFMKEFPTRESCVKIASLMREKCQKEFGDCTEIQSELCIQIDTLPDPQEDFNRW